MAPLREPTYFILAALLEGPLHGYGIAQRAGELSAGRVKLAAGTLYGAFDRLSADGLIAPDREEVVGGRKRRYYQLTDAGRDRLSEEATRLQEAATIVLKAVSA